MAVAEAMSATNDFWYCPFAYGYSNYARKGYAKYLLTYTDLVGFQGKKLQTTLGGTGLSVSAFSKNKDTALLFAEMIVAGQCQSTFYTENGGQPGHRSAWTSAAANQLTNHFFTNTLPTLDRAYVRPRYNGYLHFQDTAGDPLQQYLLHGGDPVAVLQQMNQIYKHSIVKPQPAL